MVISYLGGEFFRIQFGDTVLAYNPASKNSKLKGVSFGSDIVLSSLDHEDFNGVLNVSRGDRTPLIINGPGEYETRGIFISGFQSESKYGGKERINTIYSVTLEGMNLCFLGALSNPVISNDTTEELDEIDILFVPIGNEGVLSPSEAYKVSVNLEPKIIVPMHYGALGYKDALKTFLKEGGEESPQTVDKLTIKKKDLEGKEGDIVVISPTNT